MIIVTKYRSIDGKEFSTPYECAEYERLNPLRIAFNLWNIKQLEEYKKVGVYRTSYNYPQELGEDFLKYLDEKFLFTPKERTSSDNSNDNG